MASSRAFSKDELNSETYPSKWEMRVSFSIESAPSSSTLSFIQPCLYSLQTVEILIQPDHLPFFQQDFII